MSIVVVLENNLLVFLLKERETRGNKIYRLISILRK
jgi:hypothetical protein